jgi:hypothetical protein
MQSKQILISINEFNSETASNHFFFKIALFILKTRTAIDIVCPSTFTSLARSLTLFLRNYYPEWL